MPNEVQSNPSSQIVIDRHFTAGPVSRRLFGSFVEHMGRGVYTGIFEPDHPTATADGFRGDVLDLVRELGPTVVRYPGGNFVSGYNLEDGVGPARNRPTRLDGAWHTVESNAFGLHEFVAWAQQAEVEVMEAINLGTRGVDSARAIVEYANHSHGTQLSDLRRSNGALDPFDIKLWCLGNELDGPWQIGHKTADEYGRLAQEAAKAMRLVDPTIELILSGSSNSTMPTFGSWEYTALGHAYDEVDYVSLHAYYSERDGDVGSFLASAVDMDFFIESVIATVDAVRAKGRHKKQVNLSFDEWNVWGFDVSGGQDQPESIAASGSWHQHPRIIESNYNVTDAVVVGTLLNSLLRHGDRVKIANQAQLVNVIAPIRCEPGGASWRQSIFYPFAAMSKLARGHILRTVTKGDKYANALYGDTDLVDVSATWDEDTSRIALFIAHRGLETDVLVEVDLKGFAVIRVSTAEVLRSPHDGNRLMWNDEAMQNRVGLEALENVTTGKSSVSLRLPAVSWAVVEIEVTVA